MAHHGTTEAMLRQEGLDEAICQHISHLFTRDPLAPLAHWGREGVEQSFSPVQVDRRRLGNLDQT